MVQHQLGETFAARLGTHVHPLDLSILGAHQFDAATANGYAVIADEEEGHALGNQLLHAVAMTAFTRIERLKIRLQLGNQSCGVGSVRTFGRYDSWHTSIVSFFLGILREIEFRKEAYPSRSKPHYSLAGT